MGDRMGPAVASPTSHSDSRTPWITLPAPVACPAALVAGRGLAPLGGEPSDTAAAGPSPHQPPRPWGGCCCRRGETEGDTATLLPRRLYERNGDGGLASPPLLPGEEAGVSCKAPARPTSGGSAFLVPVAGRTEAGEENARELALSKGQAPIGRCARASDDDDDVRARGTRLTSGVVPPSARPLRTREGLWRPRARLRSGGEPDNVLRWQLAFV
jgi:hypothetical protein